MKKMYRLFALVLALALALGCFQMAAADGAADLPEVDLIYWMAGQIDQKDTDMVMTELNAIAKEALNVNLDFEIIATFGEYKEKFTKAMAAQERVDLAWSGWVMSIQDLADMGAVLPMDDLLLEYGPDLIDSLGMDLINAHRSADGKLYQFPNWQGMVGHRHYFILPKNKIDATVGEGWVQEFQDILYANWDKITVEARKAPYEKMEEFLAALKDKDMLGLGYNPKLYALENWADPSSYESVGNELGYIEIGDDTFTVKSYWESDWARYHAKLMADWFDKGYIRSDFASIAENLSATDMKFGWAGTDSDECYIMIGHNGFTEDISKELVDIVKPVYSVHAEPYCWTDTGDATVTIIPFTSAEPERAMMFMNWLVKGDELAQEWYNTYIYGIENTHYEWDADHTKITTLCGVGDPDSSWAWGQYAWTLGSLVNAWESDMYPASYYKQLDEQQRTAYTSPLTGFSFDKTDVETEATLLAAVKEEYKDMITCGYLGAAGIDAKYDEFIDKLKASGLDDYLAAYQEQLTAFVTEKGRTW